MDAICTIVAPPEPAPQPARPGIVVPEEVLPLLASLANGRGVTERMLERMDRVAEAMEPDELAKALAHSGTMMLNVARGGRALRQIVVMELETMGLREPAIARGAGSGGGGHRAGESSGGDRHDFNDTNDLNDLNDLKDEFEALFDLDEPFDREAHDDLDALEANDTFELYNRNRKQDYAMRSKFEKNLDARIHRELDYIKSRRSMAEAGGSDTDGEPQAPKDPRAAMRDLNEVLKEGADEERAEQRRTWTRRRNLLLRRRAIEKRLARHGRGPPGG